MGARTRAATRELTDIRPALLERAGYRCECCGDDFTPTNPAEHHHRRKRSAGGPHTLSNSILLTRRCHLYAPGAPHYSPAAALAAGWVISRYDRRPPDRVPMLVRGSWYLPTDEGVLAPTGDPNHDGN
jgi:hypothetical protein